MPSLDSSVKYFFDFFAAEAENLRVTILFFYDISTFIFLRQGLFHTVGGRSITVRSKLRRLGSVRQATER